MPVSTLELCVWGGQADVRAANFAVMRGMAFGMARFLLRMGNSSQGNRLRGCLWGGQGKITMRARHPRNPAA